MPEADMSDLVARFEKALVECIAKLPLKRHMGLGRREGITRAHVPAWAWAIARSARQAETVHAVQALFQDLARRLEPAVSARRNPDLRNALDALRRMVRFGEIVLPEDHAEDFWGERNVRDFLAAEARRLASVLRCAVEEEAKADRPETAAPKAKQPEVETPHALGPKPVGKRDFPDPARHTVAEMWTTKDGILHLKTKTKGRADGEITLTGKQAKLIWLCVHRYQEGDGATLSELAAEIYAGEAAIVELPQAEIAAKLLAKVRALVSDIRKKLRRANMNPDLLPSIGPTAGGGAKVRLCVAKLRDRHLQGLDEADAAPDLP